MARTSAKVQEINSLLQPEAIASFVVDNYTTWKNARVDWEDERKELRNYIFQTSTKDTTNKSLPWKNTTSVPKICQIRDNLHANYMAALFPHDSWFKWEASTQDAATQENKERIEGYMLQKIRESNFKEVVSQLVYDYIDAGNAFAEVDYVTETHTTPSGETVSTYNGPQVYRISPYDIYFDVSAQDFKSAGKVTRSVVSLGSLKKAAETNPSFAWAASAVEDALRLRGDLSAYGASDLQKSDGMQVDGFGNLHNYYTSGMVELLEYEGDVYVKETGELLTNRRIIVMDKRTVVYNEPYESWLGKSNKEHVGWRLRPDNLMAMGPLDNLVGMQYRLDHLENLRADVMDQIALPVVYQRGVVEDWEWGPGERIYGDVDSMVTVLAPDTTALNADFQMDLLMRNMEQLVGAPREAMGIRTPGEKTAFEVQSLENAAGRIFQQKVQYFEEHLVEPLLNQMLESARRNLGGVEVVKVLDEDFGVAEFLEIDADIINSKGKLYPMGARHFAKQAQLVQNLSGFINSGVLADQGVAAHVSGLKIAQLFEESLGLGKFDLVMENIRVVEAQRTQALTAEAQEANAQEIINRPEDEDFDQPVTE